MMDAPINNVQNKPTANPTTNELKVVRAAAPDVEDVLETAAGLFDRLGFAVVSTVGFALDGTKEGSALGLIVGS